MSLADVLLLLSGLVLGAIGAWIVASMRHRGEHGITLHKLQTGEREIATLRQKLEDQGRELAGERSACSAAREAVAKLEERVAQEQRASQEKLDALLAVENQLKESFEALAGKALDANSQRLLALAQQQLEKQQSDAVHDLTGRQKAIETILQPVQESLKRLTEQSSQLEVKREGAYQAVLTEIKNIQLSHTDLRRETTQLVQALRAPKVRGNWGELQLRKCVEFAGMVEYASFEVEKFVRGEEANYRPDLVVKLPNGRTIIVDAKTPLDAFLNASATEDEAQRSIHMTAHAARVREHLKALSSKAYWRQFVDSPDFIICFLPSEVLFSAALEQDPGLIEFSSSSNVLLATPTTLIALLKAISFGWQQAEVAKNAILIRDTAQSVYAKLAGLHQSFVNLGAKLKSSVHAYDDMLTKVEGRGGLFSISRKLRELGIGDKDLAVSDPVSVAPKPLIADDWQPTLSLAASAEESDKTN